MRRIYLFLIALLIPATVLFTACGGEDKKDEGEDTAKEEVKEEINHTQLLLDQIIKNGDLINSKRVPTMIKSSDVKENIGEKQLVIDIRDAKTFSEGHIKGAVNVKMSDLIAYFGENDTGKYDKVVMACYSGQSASYATSVLQMMGYKNVYAMKWGMASWNKKFAGKWKKNVSDKYESELQTESNAKGEKAELPTFECMHEDGPGILEARANKLFNDGFKPALVTVDEVMNNPADFYIINYWPKKLYSIGHLPGAIQYNPKKSLSKDADLLTLPTDKTVVTYCFTGQHSAFVTAYLRMLGYKAKSIKFGANSFMNSMMKSNEDIGHGFSDKKIHDYEFETSEYVEPEGGVEEEGGC